MTSSTYRRSANLMEADVGDELVALDPQAGNCFGFNQVATWVWRRLEKPATFDELRDGLLDEYDISSEQCTEELRAFLTEMAEKGLIAADRAPGNKDA